jgi:hypothetical protein
MFPFPTEDLRNILHTTQHKTQHDIFEHAQQLKLLKRFASKAVDILLDAVCKNGCKISG